MSRFSKEEDRSTADERRILPIWRRVSMTDSSTLDAIRIIQRAMEPYLAGRSASLKPDHSLHSTVLARTSISHDHVYSGPPTRQTIAAHKEFFRPVTAKIGPLMLISTEKSRYHSFALRIESEELQQQRQLIEAEFENKGYPVAQMEVPQHISLARLSGTQNQCDPILRYVSQTTRMVEGAEILLLPVFDFAGRICERAVRECPNSIGTLLGANEEVSF